MNINLSTSANGTNNQQTLDPVGIPADQHTGVAGEDMDAGTIVIEDAVTGRFLKADASAIGTTRTRGMIVKRVKAGHGVTSYRDAYVGGFDLDAVPFGTDLYLSDDAGRIANAPGTVSVKVAEVVSVHGQQLGAPPLKCLRVRC